MVVYRQANNYSGQYGKNIILDQINEIRIYFYIFMQVTAVGSRLNSYFERICENFDMPAEKELFESPITFKSHN